jgi:putative FmdB family regulatory protein
VRRLLDTFEELVSASSAAEVHCPACGGATVTKLLSSFATLASGGGRWWQWRRLLHGGSCGCGH